MNSKRKYNSAALRSKLAGTKGICIQCGFPGMSMDKAVKEALAFLRTLFPYKTAKRMTKELQVLMGGKPDSSLWEADHIVAVEEGGSDDPDNLQPLCIPCHALKTGMAAGERKKRRKAMEAQERVKAPDKAIKEARIKKKFPNVRMPGINAPVYNRLG